MSAFQLTLEVPTLSEPEQFDAVLRSPSNPAVMSEEDITTVVGHLSGHSVSVKRLINILEMALQGCENNVLSAERLIEIALEWGV